MGGICGTIIAVVTVMGIFWKLAKPWLVQELVRPLQETRHQVTVNGGKSKDPTLKDELSIIGGKVDGLSQDVRVLALAFNGHLVHSQTLEARFLALENNYLRESAPSH